MSEQHDAVSRAKQWLAERQLPQRDAHQTLALAVHALLLAHGFRADGASADAQLPRVWRDGAYGGLYRHGRSAMAFDIRASSVGGKLVWNATAVEDDAVVHSLQLQVSRYVRQDARDWNSALNDLDELATLVAVQLAHQLVPDSAKEGYEAAAAAAADADAATAASSSGGAQPQYVPVPVPVPVPAPEHDDPLRIGPPRHPLQPPLGAVPPFGADDLLPPALPPSFAPPRAPRLPGGNLMGPVHFGRGRGWRPPGVPPGARFDPFVPQPDNDAELPPGFDDEHGLRGPPRQGGPPRGRGGGAPDMFF